MSYSYAHYAILEQAKKMIADGVLGKIHTIAAEYPQEWVGLNTALRGKDGLTWRVDPAICGPSGVIADIGTHVEYLISKVTGLKPVRVLARLRSIPDYVPVESDAQVLIDYDNGAAGIFWTSFAMVGKSCCMKAVSYTHLAIIVSQNPQNARRDSIFAWKTEEPSKSSRSKASAHAPSPDR